LTSDSLEVYEFYNLQSEMNEMTRCGLIGIRQNCDCGN